MKRKYAFFSLLLIPAYTVLLSVGFGLTDTNLSVIANSHGRKAAFLIWGLLVGNYCFLYVQELFELEQYRDWFSSFALFLSMVLLTVGVGTPFLPEIAPGLARFHVWISFSAPILLGVVLIRYLYFLCRKYGRRLYPLWVLLLAAVFGSAILYFRVGIISSILEIFVTFSVCLYLHCLHGALERMR